MKHMSERLDNVMQISNALKKKDYLQALIFLVDMGLDSKDNKNSLMNYALEQSKPALQFVRQALDVLNPNEESQYKGSKIPQKLKVLFSSYVKYFMKSSGITKDYLGRFIGKTSQKIKGLFQKLVHRKSN